MKNNTIPLGPCNIKFNSRDLGHTLENENTVLKISPITKEIQTIESSDIKEVLELGRKISLETSILISDESLKLFEINTTLNTLIKKGVLDIVTLDGSLSIKFFNCRMTIEPTFNFKKNKYNSFKLKVIALKDEYGKDIQIDINIKEV